MSGVFQCVECRRRFGVDSVGKEFFPSTNVCFECYERLQALDARICCFGKPNVVKKKKIIRFGYDAKATECRVECPDRNICKIFVLAYGGK